MINNVTTMSLPAKPQEKTNIGMLIAPILMELIGNKINSKKIVTLNTLHTYSNPTKYVSTYLTDINNVDIKYDFFFNDSDNSELLISILKKLINNGSVYECEKNVYDCNCGMVDFLSDTSIYGNGKLFTKRDDIMYCNNCNSEVKLRKKKVLVMNYKKNVVNSLNVVPIFLANELKYFSDLFDNKEILISKQRDTGLYITINDVKYNIDVEFIWSQLYGINDDSKVMIASNHQVYVMFMMNIMNCYAKGHENLFILSPYMDNKTKFDNFDIILDNCRPLVKKLYIIFSLNWKKKMCSWDYGLFKQINKLDDNDLNEIYNYISQPIEYNNIKELTYDLSFFFEKLRFDRILSEIKNSHIKM